MKEKEINNIKILYKESSLDSSNIERVNKRVTIFVIIGTILFIFLMLGISVMFQAIFPEKISTVIYIVVSVFFTAFCFLIGVGKATQITNKATPLNYYIINFLLASDLKLFYTDKYLLKINDDYISLDKFINEYNFILEEVDSEEMLLTIDLTTTERKIVLNKKSN